MLRGFRVRGALLAAVAAAVALAWVPTALANATVTFNAGTHTTTLTDDDQRVDVQLSFAKCTTTTGDTIDCDQFDAYVGAIQSGDSKCATFTNQVLCPAAQNYVINLGGGNDTFTSANGTYFKSMIVSGGAGGDSLNAGGVVTTANNASPITYDGGPGNDYAQGGAGNDVLHGGDDSDRLFGGGGNDQIYGDAGDDGMLLGEAGADLIDGGAGNDHFLQCLDPYAITAIDPGADTFVGGSGNDTLCYDTRPNGVSVTLDGLANDGEPGENDNVGGDIEEIYGTANNDQLTGNSLGQTINGNGGDDTINGLGGADVLIGSNGNDNITGGAGMDVVYGGQAVCDTACDTGNDVINVKDGEVDSVICGLGFDRVIADFNDAINTDPINGCESISRAGGRCVVPKVKGKTLGAARRAIVRAHCAVGAISKAYSKRVKKGRVIAQRPRPGASRRAGAKVSLVVSRGKKR